MEQEAREQARRDLVKRLEIRRKAYAKVDEALDMYEQGMPLSIICRLSWTTTTAPIDDEMTIAITAKYS